MKEVAKRFLILIETICISFLILIALAIGLQILCRIFRVGIIWTEELAQLSFCLMSFVGAPLVFVEGQHIVVDMIVNFLPLKIRRVVEIMISIAVGMFSVFVIRSSILNFDSYANVYSVSIPWLKMNWLFAVILSSFFLLLLISVIRIICIINGKSITMRIYETSDDMERI
ncbi:MAG: TRAP transporter small permease subunit [Prevotellaceae bacterium]|jgi:TRAP-type C4-dicarboxylate transport system permease small subunit|nr:TRAP transporter small permease subunit [Prevotellaceae bacterium]